MIQLSVIFFILLLWSPSLVQANDWPQFRGPERTGVSKETGLLPAWPSGGPKRLWTFRDAGLGYSGLSVVGDRLYTMGGNGNKDCVLAVDLKTQKKIWTTEVGPYCRGWGGGPMSTPTVDGNFLYTLGGEGDLVCVEIATGKKIWSQGLKTTLEGRAPVCDYSESPFVDGDLVVATPGGEKGAIAAFDKKTGTLKWRSAECTDGACNGSMIAISVDGMRQYVQLTWSSIIGLRVTDGKVLWSFPFGTGIAIPIYHNRCVYVSNTHIGSKLFKLTPHGDQCKAEQLYVCGAIRNYHGGIILVGDYLYGFSNKATNSNDGDGWICQHFQTGKTIWKKKAAKSVNSGSATFADGHLYCFHDDGTVLLIKATSDDYRERGRFRIERSKSEYASDRLPYTYPVVANGKLYLRDRELISCYDIRKPQ